MEHDHAQMMRRWIWRDFSNILLGIWLAGALVVTWAVIAFGEVARPVRLLNIIVGLWLVAAPWALSGDTDLSRWNDMIVGGLLIVLSLPRGRIEARVGGWNRYLI